MVGAMNIRETLEHAAAKAAGTTVKRAAGLFFGLGDEDLIALIVSASTEAGYRRGRSDERMLRKKMLGQLTKMVAVFSEDG